MTSPRIWLATMAALSAAALAACDSEATPPGTSTSKTPTTTSSPVPSTPTDPAKQAPKVRNPVDIKEFVDDPCRSLTPTQLTELQLIDPQENRGDGAYEAEDGCNYNLSHSIDMTAYVNYFPRIKTGLNSVYADRPADATPYWKPTEIDGHPAVVNGARLNPAICHVYVGTSDTTFFGVTYYYYDTNDWDGRDTCAAATAIATAVLTNIKAAN